MTLVVQAAGMVTAVGLDAASSCAAMRARIDGFAETRFIGSDGNWMIGAAVPLPRNWIGQKRMIHLAAGAMVDILDTVPDLSNNDALILCLAERDRPGKPISDIPKFASDLAEVTKTTSKLRTRIIEHGRPSGFAALQQAEKLMAEGKANRVLIVGVDSYLTGGAINHYRERILGPANPNGFIPGEAAAAVLVSNSGQGLKLTGLGLSRENAHIYNQKDKDGLDLPLRADGMTNAYKAAFAQAGYGHDKITTKIGDLIGETFWFKQSALAQLRTQRERSKVQPIWPVAASLGNVGAAVVPLMIGWALAAASKNYAEPGPLLIEASGDDGSCGVTIAEAA
jgi:3-oxoacyl-[acyl-carrier-protein] synthase-1